MSRAVRIGLSVAVSLLLLGFAVRGVDWGEALDAMKRASYVYIFLMIPVTVWSLYVRAQRWRVFLHAVGTPPMGPLVSATNIGFMANMVLPLRVGEVIRPVLLSRREKLPLSGVLGSCLLERIFDMFSILLLFGVAVALVDVSDTVQQWGYALMTVAGTAGVIVGMLRFQEELALGFSRRVCGLLPEKIGVPIHSFVQGFVGALSMLDSPVAFMRAFGWTLFLWGVISLLYILGFQGFHLDVPPILGALVMTTLVSIAVSVPSAPGFIGAFQLGCVLGLGIFGVGESEAVAFSIVAHITQFVAVIGAGLYSLWRENMSLREIEAAEEA